MESEAIDIIKATPKRIRKASFVLSFVIILISILLAPMLIDGLIGELFLQVCFYLLIMFTMYTLETDRKLLLTAFFLAIPLFFCDLLCFYYNSLEIATVTQSLLTAYLLFSIIFITWHVVKESVINTNLIFGAIMVYFLAGILWGKLYWLANIYQPNSFKGLNDQIIHPFNVENILSNQFDLVYYSFTTMATLGLGDIVPMHRLARSLTVLQAIFGQLFIAIAIAKMVSIWNMGSLKNNVKL